MNTDINVKAGPPHHEPQNLRISSAVRLNFWNRKELGQNGADGQPIKTRTTSHSITPVERTPAEAELGLQAFIFDSVLDESHIEIGR